MPRTSLLVILGHLLVTAPLAAQGGAPGAITGSVRAVGRPVAHAQVTVRGTTLGAVADSLGRYVIAGVDAGTHTLVVRAIGHTPATRQVTVRPGVGIVVDLELRPSAGTLAAVVTTGTLKETYVEDSPVKVAVLTPRFLERNVTANLMDNLPFVNGLAQQVDCGVCFTNSIRINGMEGPYTQVLIDGAPVMSALATVYGFNGIDPSLIQQVEIVKGPQSTLYGSEAMGGVINVVTKDPRFAPRLSTTAFVTSHGETSLAMGMAPSAGERVSAILSGSLAHNRTFVDANADGFSDLPLTTRAALFAKGAHLLRTHECFRQRTLALAILRDLLLLRADTLGERRVLAHQLLETVCNQIDEVIDLRSIVAAHCAQKIVLLLPYFDGSQIDHTWRSPKRTVPRRTMVLPSSIAIS